MFNTMKMIILVAVTALFGSLNVSAYIGSGPGQSNRTDASGNWIHSEIQDISVINDTGSTASKGSAMCVSTSDDDGYRVSECSVEGGKALCFLEESCADHARCRCRKRGKVSANWVDSGTGTEDATAGQCVYVSGNDNGAVQGIAADTALESGSVYPNCLGVFLDSDAADDASVDIWVDL